MRRTKAVPDRLFFCYVHLMHPHDVFLCRNRSSVMSESDCAEAFTDAHAFEKSEDACWGCPRGAARRMQAFSGTTGTPDDDEVTNMLEYCDFRTPGKGRKVDRISDWVSSYPGWWRKSLVQSPNTATEGPGSGRGSAAI